MRPRHRGQAVYRKGVIRTHIFALGQLFAVCGVPLAVVVGGVVVVRTIYVLSSRRE